ncbi:MAG: YraN family protein [Sphingomonadaceae bacterium]
MTAKRKLADQRGRQAEDEAATWLEARGWDMLDRRRKTKSGEIDLICRKDGLVAFVEVKWRKSAAELDFAIDEYRLRRVAAAVEAVAHEYATGGEDIRIDVILLAPGTEPRHIENAWMP